MSKNKEQEHLAISAVSSCVSWSGNKQVDLQRTYKRLSNCFNELLEKAADAYMVVTQVDVEPDLEKELYRLRIDGYRVKIDE